MGSEHVDLAVVGLILLEFPCELVSAIVAGKWAAASSPFKPWMVAFRVRLLMAAATTTIVSTIHQYLCDLFLKALHHCIKQSLMRTFSSPCLGKRRNDDLIW